MRASPRIFFTGMGISFLGALPLGNLNITAMQIAISDGIARAIYFSLGALLVEMIYVRISLVAMDWVRKRRNLFLALEWITLAVIIALAISSFLAATNPQAAKNIILDNTPDRFLLGIALSAVNPVQIPFWFGWSTVLISRRILLPKKNMYNVYIAGIGLGTLAGHCIFIFGGRWMVDRLNANPHLVQWGIGAVFSLTAIWQAWKLMRHTDAFSKLPSVPGRDHELS